jgi:hypothetical protein
VCGTGDILLLHFLSDQLRAKLVLWGMPVQPQEPVKYSDAGGNPLPKEALGIDGKPDHELSGVAPDSMITYPAVEK